MADEPIAGEFFGGRNWSADAAGGIHDDATASGLGFRGGTVAGNIHMDQFVPVLCEAFGEEWLSRGTLSLYFRNATTDGERVRVTAERPEDRRRIRVWMHRDDGTEVMSGSASLGPDPESELRTRDLRPCDPSSLRILNRLRAGAAIPTTRHRLTSERQLDRFRRHWLSLPISSFSDASRFGGIVATPSSIVDLLWGVPTAIWRAEVGNAVGLFGAIEIALHAGPLLLDRDYLVDARIAALTDSPKTEAFWFDSEARDEAGALVASHRMLLRFMKASSPLYAA